MADYIGLERLDFLFNFLVLLLLIASFLQMTLGLGEKSLEHLASIRELTNFLTTLNDLELIDSPTPDFCDRTIERLNDQYKVINSTLPSNSDAEWKKAKKLLGQKEGST